MKTLEEVIEKLENARVQVETGNGYWVDYRDNDELKTDALHYLKEYRKYNDTMCALPDYYEWVHSADNPPLTWDELKQMEGKPVWIELHGSGRKAWGLSDGIYVDAFGHDIITIKVLHDLWHLDKAQLGKNWNAYKKEWK